MMKKKWMPLFAVLILLIIAITFWLVKQPKKETQESDKVVQNVSQTEEKDENLPDFVDVETTEELRALFKDIRFDKVPRIFVRRFPDDFAEKGDPALFAAVLLPHLLRENELLLEERKVFTFLSEKVENGEELSDVEEAMWDKLVLKYEVLDPDKAGQRETLYSRIDRISPSLAVAQALEATQLGKNDLDAPFDLRRWNDKKEYDFVHYSNLAAAVSDYAWEINRGFSFFKFHILRREQRASLYHPLIGRSFARGMVYYKIEDPDYVQKLKKIFDWFKIKKLDESKFIEE